MPEWKLVPMLTSTGYKEVMPAAGESPLVLFPSKEPVGVTAAPLNQTSSQIEYFIWYQNA